MDGEVVGEEIMLVDVFELVKELDPDEVLKLDVVETEMTDELVTGSEMLDLELLRELIDVELIEVLDMGYLALLELI